jgi:class 3 adenylate cyclase
VVENPYFHRGPIKRSTYFYGRVRETGRILGLLRNGQSVSIVGPRKIGKTSLLLHLADPQVRAEHKLNSQRYLFAYVDAEALSGLHRSDIYRVMLEEIGRQLASADKNAVIEDVGGSDLQFYQFGRIIRALSERGWKLVYLIDEFECLGKNQRLREDFFSGLRSLVLHDVVYITASQKPLLELTLQEDVLSSPFFNIFAAHRLGLLSLDEAVRLISVPSQKAGVQFSQQMVDFVLELVGLHPFCLQVACYHAFELVAARKNLGEQDYHLLEEKILSDLTDHFSYYLDRLREEEKRSLACLARFGEDVLSPEASTSLRHQCLVVGHGDGYRCQSRVLERFVVQELASSWEAAVTKGERRLVTILFVDLVGSTPMAEKRRPEEVTRLMKQLTRLFSEPVERHGGVVIQFTGDGILAVFGVPVVREDDARRAVLASLEIQSNLRVFGQEMVAKQEMELYARVGLNTGVVVVDAMGTEQYSEHTVIGDAVNLAERMQRVAEPGGIAISEHTYQQVRGVFKVHSMGPIQVKGKTEQIKVYSVLGVK